MTKHLGGRFPGSRDSHFSIQLHGEPFTHVGRVFIVRLEEDKGQAEKRLGLGVVGEIEIQVGLDGTAAAPAVRADADILGDPVPGEGRMIVGIQQVVLLERRPIVGVHGEVDHLHGAVVEERVSLDLREGCGARCRYGAGQKRKAAASEAGAGPTFPSAHSNTWTCSSPFAGQPLNSVIDSLFFDRL